MANISLQKRAVIDVHEDAQSARKEGHALPHRSSPSSSPPPPPSSPSPSSSSSHTVNKWTLISHFPKNVGDCRRPLQLLHIFGESVEIKEPHCLTNYRVTTTQTWRHIQAFMSHDAFIENTDRLFVSHKTQKKPPQKLQKHNSVFKTAIINSIDLDKSQIRQKQSKYSLSIYKYPYKGNRGSSRRRQRRAASTQNEIKEEIKSYKII
ncbi:uncharacterized protein LOC122970713 [Thunnus albacares]|uniref:uncharacterized protein LOC122970713 n=1 Tax=Thunnus albacares TaxID=8236 RepID=UPI001CF71BFB|nr:uncharacterized protein LOC122970713 [Thunnus albacares]